MGKLALEILNGFYNKGTKFVQYTPPNADREGNTVGDKAPEAFSGEYSGAKAESKGIIGILEVILSDFDRNSRKTTSDEEEAHKEHQKFEEDTNEDIGTKANRVEKAKGEIADA